MPPVEGYVFFAEMHPQTERRLVELLATLGHEFRTPLTVIEGYTLTLLRRARDLTQEEHDEFLQMIQQASKHMEFLVTRLLEIAELEAGVFQIEWNLVDIPALAREAIALAHQHIPEPLRDRFTFHLECRDELGTQTEEVPPVWGDESCLRKVLEYLLENAIRYSPQGGRIDVITRTAPQGSNASEHDQSPKTPSFLEICVCDFGLGIPDEHLEPGTAKGNCDRLVSADGRIWLYTSKVRRKGGDVHRLGKRHRDAMYGLLHEQANHLIGTACLPVQSYLAIRPGTLLALNEIA